MRATTVQRVVVVFSILAMSSVLPEATEPPRPEGYRVSEIYAGPYAPVDLKSNPEAGKFRTQLAEGAHGPPDFAGHYRVVSWGCGTNCQRVALVDLKSGEVFFTPGSNLGVEHQASSSLLVVNPPHAVEEFHEWRKPEEERLFHSYYFVWEPERRQLRLIWSDEPTNRD